MKIIEKANDFFTKNEKGFVILSLILATITSLLLFDVKVSLSGDDCDYIVAAGDFWKDFLYPGHHGPLYPIILSPFVGLFGVNLILLKSLSTLFIIASLWFFYLSFKRIIPAAILIPSLFLVSINPHIMFFASYTYSEPLFLFMQALFFYLFSKYFWKNDQNYTFQKDWRKYLSLALVIMGMGLTRTIGFCVIGVIIIYFITERRWKDLLYTIGIFSVIFCLFYFSKPLIWPNSSSVQSFETLFAKNPYNPEQGTENFAGLIQRIVENSNIYLSGYLYQYLGFRSPSNVPLKDIPALSIFTYILFIICFISTFKKNKPLLFTGLYAGTLIFASFILLHKMWAQDRIIMVYYPYALLFLLGGIYYIFSQKPFKNVSVIYLITVICLFIGVCIHAKDKITKNIPILQQNILGNDLYGLTPDWENFIKMSRWANEKFDQNTVIASRKPTISYVYTGRRFLGIYNVPYVNINDITKQYSAETGEHIFLTIEMNQHASALISSLAPYLQYVFISKRDGTYFINEKQVQTAITYKISKELIIDDIMDHLNTNQINYTLDYNTFLKQYVEDTQVRYQIIDPDILLKDLKDNNVRYLILAKIRIYTPQNTGQYVNTIHQYISFINLKYPNKFNLIHTIGKDETCELAEFIGN